MNCRSETDVEVGFAILGRLIHRGADPRMDADGRLWINGPAIRRESSWVREHRDAFRSALVGAGRYAPGSLDKIYKIGETS